MLQQKNDLFRQVVFLLGFGPLGRASHHFDHLTAEINSAYDDSSLRSESTRHSARRPEGRSGGRAGLRFGFGHSPGSCIFFINNRKCSHFPRRSKIRFAPMTYQGASLRIFLFLNPNRTPFHSGVRGHRRFDGRNHGFAPAPVFAVRPIDWRTGPSARETNRLAPVRGISSLFSPRRRACETSCFFRSEPHPE